MEEVEEMMDETRRLYPLGVLMMDGGWVFDWQLVSAAGWWWCGWCGCDCGVCGVVWEVYLGVSW